jgi:hypothetical protein
MALSEEVRRDILSLRDKGLSPEQIEHETGVNTYASSVVINADPEVPEAELPASVSFSESMDFLARNC